MGQEDILNELVTRGEVPVGEINTKFKPKGPVSQQLSALRKKGLVDRKLVNRHFVYFPTPEAIALELARQREAGVI